jgi:hypothetical protein
MINIQRIFDFSQCVLKHDVAYRSHRFPNEGWIVRGKTVVSSPGSPDKTSSTTSKTRVETPLKESCEHNIPQNYSKHVERG